MQFDIDEAVVLVADPSRHFTIGDNEPDEVGELLLEDAAGGVTYRLPCELKPYLAPKVGDRVRFRSSYGNCMTAEVHAILRGRAVTALRTPSGGGYYAPLFRDC